MQHYLCRFPKGFFVSLCVYVCVLGDIISSLHSRLDIIYDEADGQLESIADDGESVNENSTQTPTLQLQLQLLRSDSCYATFKCLIQYTDFAMHSSN